MESHRRGRSRQPSTTRYCRNITLLLRQFLLLLGKNFLLQIRRPIGTVFEILIPIVAIGVLVAFRLGIPSLGTTKKCFQTFGSDPISIPAIPATIYYAPNNTQEIQALASYVTSKLSDSNITLIGVATEDELVSVIQSNDYENEFCGSTTNGEVGIIFDNINQSDIQYSIRMSPDLNWQTDATYPVFQFGARVHDVPYFTTGFMQLEKIIDESIIEWKTGSPLTLNVDVRQFPFPGYNQNFFLEVLNIVLPLFIVIALMFSVGVFVKELVLEKESRMKETMRMMGLSNWILVSTWFIKQILFYLIIIIIMALLLKFGKIYPRSDLFLLILLLMFYFMAAIAFSFLVSVWFSSARLGMFAGFVIWFLSFVPFFFLNRYTIPFGGEMGASVISNLCMSYAVKILSVLEVQEDGLQFSNIGTPVSVEDQLSMGWLMLMLIFDTVLYLGLYWYIDAVKPGKYGTPKPFYFLFLPSFWLGNAARRRVNTNDSFTIPVYDASAHETEPDDLEVGIAIDRLTKIYNRFTSRNKKIAVDTLSLNMYKGQITALLGHNGAGKTTIMSILTGLYTPTTGSAYINGYNVLSDMNLIRRSMGICPQHNVLFDRLTVSEHLTFFCMLKGMPTRKVKAEVKRMITDLQLPDKRNTLAKKLSGGMKRKLSVGIALVGQSEVVILDEPTSGMDPYARRATWDLLIKHKKGRTILLTTHFMDEADLLGDRIAIIADGRLKCSGSSLFLKTRYGIGYHMTIVKEPGCNSGKLIDIVKRMVTESEAVTDVGAELSFVLPSQSKNQFPELFDVLESEKVELGISSFGVSITTMEEVFIKVGLGEDATLESKLLGSQSTVRRSTQAAIEQSASLEGQDNELEEEEAEVSFRGESSFLLQEHLVGSEIQLKGVSDDTDQYGKFHSHPYTLNKGVVLWFQQVFAIFVKHLYHATRFWPSVIWQIIVPLFFVILCLALAASKPGEDTNNAARLLSVKNTAPSKTITFFWANLGGVISPVDFKSSDSDTLGVSSFHKYSDDIERLKQQVSNYSSINQCCSYQYQILDKFCASRTTGEYYSQCSDQQSFGYSACTSCIGCNYNRHKSCTNPKDHSNTDCPLSPAVSYADLLAGDQLQGPLDDYDTYVAEQLLDISGSLLNPNAFFTVYQGGFVVHPETHTYSTCGCVGDDANVCSNLSPTLKYNYPPEDGAEFLAKSIELYNGDIRCDQIFPNNCSDDANDWNHEYNWAVKFCIDKQDTDCYCYNKTSCGQIFGGITETPPTIVQPKVTVWYNNQPFHMAPAVLNSFYSLYLKEATGNTITVTNKPLPLSSSEQVESNDAGTFLSSGFILSYGGVFGMCFLFSSFILFLVQERESKAKHIQFVSGVGATSYWIGTFLFDVVNALIPSTLILITFAAFNVEGLRDENLAVVFILFFLSSWAAIPISYMFSFLFTNSLIGFSLLIMFHYFIFVILQVTTLLVSDETQNILFYIFLLHPTYGLGSGLADMYNNQLIKDICTKSESFEKICRDKGYTYLDTMFVFKRPGVLWTFVYLFAEGLFFLFLTVLLERRFFIPELSSLFRSKTARYNYSLLQEEDPDEDSDVADERRKIHSEQMTDNDIVIIKDLEKVYSRLLCRCKSKRAVNGINLTVPAGECFGLLGVNGAGKTTTFNILTGDLSLTNGSAKIAGHYISSQLHEVQKKIGYCPQFDAIIELLTGRELLTMFARLRGIPESHIKSAVQFEIERLDLKQHANKRCGNYSGGNKRKLSTAIALIGSPPVLFLDEPTTGMDPVTRRFLWDAITNIVREGQSVILTSHSMEECEALCSRLAIMVNGKFKCLGSTQHLKNKYGAGYVMEIRVAEGITDTDDDTTQQQVMSGQITATVQMFIASHFPNAVLLESHQESVTYQIPAQGVTWSSMFRTIEDNKERFNIINYTISQTTLDQVFINFAKEQEVVTGDYN